jgi:ketosteroid isomerase-like protein
MSQENVEMARRSLVAFNRRDFEALRTLNNPDVELDWSASRGLEAGVYRGWEGRDGIEAVARSALVFEVRSGRIVRLCLYQETRQALEAVGLSEQSPEPAGYCSGERRPRPNGDS